MAFKHNLPIPALILLLLAGAIAALVIFHRPPQEDRLRQAVDAYVATIGPVAQLEIHGNVADIVTRKEGRLVYAEFEERNGTWTYARNLAEEFSKAMKDPAVQSGILRHLAEKVGQRLQMSVTFKEGIDFRYEIGRDREMGLVGKCIVNFAYPRSGEQQRRGQYVENFEWKDGAWRSWGPGALFDKIGP